MDDLEFAYIYIDNILIVSENENKHEIDIQQVFRRLSEAGINLNLSKCSRSGSEVSFLGYRVLAAGIAPLADSVRAINEAPRPSTIAELRSFLGLLNFYRRFMPQTAITQHMLFKLRKDTRKKDKQEVVWSSLKTIIKRDCFGPPSDLPLALMVRIFL